MGDSLESGMMRRLFNSKLNSVKNYFGRDQWFYAWDELEVFFQSSTLEMEMQTGGHN